MAGDGAVLVTEDGQEFRAEAPKGKLVNSVGAGDSMVAGFIYGYLMVAAMQMHSAMVYVPEVPVLFPKNWQQKGSNCIDGCKSKIILRRVYYENQRFACSREH